MNVNLDIPNFSVSVVDGKKGKTFLFRLPAGSTVLVEEDEEITVCGNGGSIHVDNMKHVVVDGGERDGGKSTVKVNGCKTTSYNGENVVEHGSTTVKGGDLKATGVDNVEIGSAGTVTVNSADKAYVLKGVVYVEVEAQSLFVHGARTTTRIQRVSEKNLSFEAGTDTLVVYQD